ncbi:MAG: hypothetical protein EBZ49_00235 [Proteobacteria bacterium]|nr:hypothetical protein [Pseudomonadota bacterium]
MKLTEDLYKFDRWQKEDLSHTLWAWINRGLPKEFEPVDVRPALDIDSGRVLLKNSKEQLVSLYFGELEFVYICPNSGNAGFFEELVDEFHLLCNSDRAWLRNLAMRLGKNKLLMEKQYDKSEFIEGPVEPH